MNMKKMMVVAALGLAAQTFAAVTITNVVCRQRYPWNGLVDIDYEIRSDNASAKYFVYPKGEDRRLGTPIVMRTLTGDGAAEPVGIGTHRMTWDAKADMPAFHTPDFAVTLQALSQGAQYLVVDLSGGTNSVTYPVRYSTTPPDITNDKCRTTELWLRLVLPGTFMMGSPTTEDKRGSNEQHHQVRLTRPYYIGVFELTQKQWMLVSGTTNAIYYTGDCRPADAVSYNMIRGNDLGAQWPNSDSVDVDSFMGILRRKTTLKFDLPTEAQWEYACRAETTTEWNDGSSGGYVAIPGQINAYKNSRLDNLGRHTYNSGDGRDSYAQHTTVGLYQPNNWGIYDMHGNICEWCRDGYRAVMTTSAEVDPTGGESAASRSRRGGGWSDAPSSCRAASRTGNDPNVGPNPQYVADRGKFGFRVACLLNKILVFSCYGQV